jgi:hypothetical protein
VHPKKKVVTNEIGAGDRGRQENVLGLALAQILGSSLGQTPLEAQETVPGRATAHTRREIGYLW